MRSPEVISGYFYFFGKIFGFKIDLYRSTSDFLKPKTKKEETKNVYLDHYESDAKTIWKSVHGKLVRNRFSKVTIKLMT